MWDLIRDWFVQYIWGGLTSNNDYYGGLFANFSFVSDDGYMNNYGWYGTSGVLFPIKFYPNHQDKI